jgi:hypothetical protein
MWLTLAEALIAPLAKALVGGLLAWLQSHQAKVDAAASAKAQRQAATIVAAKVPESAAESALDKGDI